MRILVKLPAAPVSILKCVNIVGLNPCFYELSKIPARSPRLWLIWDTMQKAKSFASSYVHPIQSPLRLPKTEDTPEQTRLSRERSQHISTSTSQGSTGKLRFLKMGDPQKNGFHSLLKYTKILVWFVVPQFSIIPELIVNHRLSVIFNYIILYPQSLMVKILLNGYNIYILRVYS